MDKGPGAAECWAGHVAEGPGWGGVLRQVQNMVEKDSGLSLQASETGPLGRVDLESLLQTAGERSIW